MMLPLLAWLTTDLRSKKCLLEWNWTNRERLSCFFFQAEDGIRDLTVTGVQTCALPISVLGRLRAGRVAADPQPDADRRAADRRPQVQEYRVRQCGGRHHDVPRCERRAGARSEERRVGKEGRSRWSPDH